MIFCIITMFFSGGLIPTFILIRELELFNTFWVMVIPGLMSVWNMIIFRTFSRRCRLGLRNQRKSMDVDIGEHSFESSFHYQVRLSLHWDYLQQSTIGMIGFHPSIYISDQDLLPIQTMLQQILSSNIMSEQMAQADSAAAGRMAAMKTVSTKSLSMATMMVATIPIICVILLFKSIS